MALGKSEVSINPGVSVQNALLLYTQCLVYTIIVYNNYE